MRELKRELWPHKVVIKNRDRQAITEIESWLGKKLGALHYQWNIVHYIGGKADFYFKQEQDAIMFSLRWAS
jgi:hypothetical protein